MTQMLEERRARGQDSQYDKGHYHMYDLTRVGPDYNRRMLVPD